MQSFGKDDLIIGIMEMYVWHYMEAELNLLNFVLVQAGPSCHDIANNCPKPIQPGTVLQHLARCAALGLLQPHELQRLVEEGRIDGHVARAVHEAMQHISDCDGMGVLKASLPPTMEYFKIMVCQRRDRNLPCQALHVWRGPQGVTVVCKAAFAARSF